MDDLPDVLTLAQLMEFLAQNGHPRSHHALWLRITKSKTLPATKIGTQWVVTKSQAQVLLEELRAQDS